MCECEIELVDEVVEIEVDVEVAELCAVLSVSVMLIHVLWHNPMVSQTAKISSEIYPNRIS